MKVLIIPEDPTLDQHVLRPVVAGIFADLKRPARVDVLTDPHLKGVDQALDRQIVANIIADNPMVDLFILAIDRDCNRKKNESLAQARVADHPDRLLACLAVQEVEVWALALHRGELTDKWSEIRADCDPKERFWDPFIARKGWGAEVGKGRKRAMRALAGHWSGLLQVCPEIAALKAEIAAWMKTRMS